MFVRHLLEYLLDDRRTNGISTISISYISALIQISPGARRPTIISALVRNPRFTFHLDGRFKFRR